MFQEEEDEEKEVHAHQMVTRSKNGLIAIVQLIASLGRGSKRYIPSLIPYCLLFCVLTTDLLNKGLPSSMLGSSNLGPFTVLM